MESPELVSRAQACLLGAAVGDALGATVEFLTPSEIRARHGVHRRIRGGGWLRLRPGQVTDDTEMSLCLARALVRVGGWDPSAAAEEFAHWLRSGPVDVGSTCARGIRRYLHFKTLTAPPCEWDAGNGAVMRVAPAALFSVGDDSLLERVAVEQARLTHNHPLSDAACVAVGRLVHLGLRGAPARELLAVAQALESVHPSFAFRSGPGPAGGFVGDTLRAVFHSLFTTTSFEQCLVRVVNLGGDADTTGTIAGAVAGALYGLEGLPRQWTRRLGKDVREELLRLGAKLVALSPALRSGR